MSQLPNALVTGAAGFLGSHLMRALQADGRVHPVGLDDLSGGFVENLSDEMELVVGSVVDAALVAEIFDRYHFQYVFHLAAYAAESLSHHIRRFNYTTNLVGGVNLINESVRHEVRCFVFTSSIAVYGRAPSPVFEAQACRPEDPYGIAKLATELDLAAAHAIFGLPTVIFRPHNVYGEHQNLSDPYRNVVAIFMNQVLRGQPMSIFGDGTQQRAFSYVGDIVPTIAESPWIPAAIDGTFNVGASQPYTIGELAAGVAAALGSPRHPIEYLEPRPEVPVIYADHQRSLDVFGPSSTTSLTEGLTRMAAWARRAGARPVKRFAEIEVPQGLPSYWTRLPEP